VLDANSSLNKIRPNLSYPPRTLNAFVGKLLRRESEFEVFWEGVTEFELPLTKEKVFKGAGEMMFD
jgi:hypothetical protein